MSRKDKIRNEDIRGSIKVGKKSWKQKINESKLLWLGRVEWRSRNQDCIEKIIKRRSGVEKIFEITFYSIPKKSLLLVEIYVNTYGYWVFYLKNSGKQLFINVHYFWVYNR